MDFSPSIARGCKLIVSATCQFLIPLELRLPGSGRGAEIPVPPMPWKTTKLKFCGLPVRRRTLYVLTLFFAIAAVPAVSWALLNSGENVPRNRQLEFLGGAAAVVFLALNGWWSIIRTNAVLYREEAKFIWPGAIVLLGLVTWMACDVAERSFNRGQLDYIAPLAFGGALMIFLLLRCVLIGRHQKRSDIVRGGPSRRSRSLPVGNVLLDELAKQGKIDLSNEGVFPRKELGEKESVAEDDAS